MRATVTQQQKQHRGWNCTERQALQQALHPGACLCGRAPDPPNLQKGVGGFRLCICTYVRARGGGIPPAGTGQCLLRSVTLHRRDHRRSPGQAERRPAPYPVTSTGSCPGHCKPLSSAFRDLSLK